MNDLISKAKALKAIEAAARLCVADANHNYLMGFQDAAEAVGQVELEHLREATRKKGDDYISRQAAIDALSLGKEILSRVLDDTDVVGTDREKYSWGLELIEANIKDIEELPSAQPDHFREVTKKVDLISRQDAIEDAREAFKRNPTMAIRVMDLIKSMPSAQPEMAIANGENDMDKNEVMKILETAKDKNGDVPMRLVRQAFEKLPEPCKDTISRQAGRMDISDDIKNAYYDGYDNGYNAGFEAGQRDVLLEKTQLSRENTTSDSISRQAAIDAVDNYIGTFDAIDVNFLDGLKTAKKLMMQLPSAQPTQLNTPNTLEALDCISRQEAIAKLEPWLKAEGYSEGELNMLRAVLYELMFLPPAQPELIEKASYVRGFEQGRTQGMIDAKEGKK